MRYLLDTNVCVDYLSGRYPSVAARLQRSSPEEICLSSVVVAELRSGADRSRRRRENHERLDLLTAEIPCVDFDLTAAAAFGRVRVTLEEKGVAIGPYDMLIAAQALALGLVLVTANLREFERVVGLELESWREPEAPSLKTR
ncbi:MAG: type II toxin-antitoxin system VapC family toxin [Acidobacteriota bacterium]|nr:type II toxin-antitoxin system VapC family toxin [Acidobacteriota bacterium]